MQSTRNKSESEIKFIEFSQWRQNVFALCEKEEKTGKKIKKNNKKNAEYSPCHLIEYF